MGKYTIKQKRVDRFKKELKLNRTKSESILYNELKRLNVKFNFQKAYYNEDFVCIVDFFLRDCKKKKIAIEIDGGYHNTPEQKRKDKYREKWILEKRHCHIVRFTNEEVENDLKRVVYEIGCFLINIDDKPTSSNNNKIFREVIHSYLESL